MAKKEDINEFIKKQMGEKPVTLAAPKTAAPVVPAAPVTPKQVNVNEPAAEETDRRKRTTTSNGKIPVTVYLTPEMRDKLTRIQHMTYRTRFNDVLTEACQRLIDMYL